MSAATALAKHIHFFFELREQLKLYHWQTTSYSRHTGTDRILGELDSKIDSFVEVWIGKYDRPRLTTATRTITVGNLSEKQAVVFVKKALLYLIGPLSASLNPAKDMDLANIRDEIIGSLNQLLYLFTLH
jgi:hypothetical protein